MVDNKKDVQYTSYIQLQFQGWHKVELVGVVLPRGKQLILPCNFFYRIRRRAKQSSWPR